MGFHIFKATGSWCDCLVFCILYFVEGTKKVIWSIITFLSLVLLVTHLTYLILIYAKFETTSEVKLISAKLLDFPGVNCMSTSTTIHMLL